MKDENQRVEKYTPTVIEPKWQKKWEEEGLYQAEDFSNKKKYYTLIEFPYPSGAGLHVGHVRSWSAMDAYSRKKRMENFNVLYPIGWDAFGLPAENYAIKMKVHPSAVVPKNIATFKKQIKALGISFDWSREVNTTDPKYYKWTQWIFLQFYKKGLAFQADVPVNWCPQCKTTLADEEVLANGTHERCGCPVERRMQKQWLLKITAYADRLLKDLDLVDYSQRIRVQQENWIGRSVGANIKFTILDNESVIEVFTTRPDTIFGVTAVVLAPEHPIVASLLNSKVKTSFFAKASKDKQNLKIEEVKKYVESARRKSELERTSLDKEKTGVFIGLYAINPVNQEKIPVWVGDYVIGWYGKGAVMVVPAHDGRDYEFAKNYGLEIKEVIEGGDISKAPYEGEGDLINSQEFNGQYSTEAKKSITKWLKEHQMGEETVQYKIRDWVFSRQHYWGEPIPIIYCEACKNKKYKYLLLHGRHGGSKQDFFPWLKKELEEKDHQVYAPDMPNTEDPKVEEQADFVIKNFKIDEDTIIVAHSLGGPVAMNILEKTGQKVAKVIFVDTLICPKFTDKRRLDLERNFHWKFDFDKIRKLAGEFVDLADQDFPIITPEQFLEKNRLLNTKLLYVKPNANHFNSAIEPIILEHALDNGVVPVPEEDLPVELPFIEKYEPTGTGESPLAKVTDWVNTQCPKCGEKAKRETDTMPNWAGSNWYYLAYLFANKLDQNSKCKMQNAKLQFKIQKEEKEDDIFSENKDLIKYWMPIDIYQGGFEHTTLHLLYSRFVYKFLFDLGVVPGPEPYAKRRSHGIVLGTDGRKMSKSFGNVINPEEIAGKFGADALRVYEMFMGPFDQTIAWSEEGVEGCFRFLKRIWQLSLNKTSDGETSKPLLSSLHKTIKKVGEDIEVLKFNTAVASMMEFINQWQVDEKGLNVSDLKDFLLILSPIAPHITEELWQRFTIYDLRFTNEKKQNDKSSIVNDQSFTSIHSQSWPSYDPKLLEEKEVNIAVQVNGKVREVLMVQSSNLSFQNEIEKIAKESERVNKYLEGKTIKKVVYIEGKVINFVVE